MPRTHSLNLSDRIHAAHDRDVAPAPAESFHVLIAQSKNLPAREARYLCNLPRLKSISIQSKRLDIGILLLHDSAGLIPEESPPAQAQDYPIPTHPSNSN